MKVPIRMITVATSFTWILLIIFSVSAIYSMKDIRMDVGKPKTNITPDNYLMLDFPIGIVNGAYYNLNDFNISTEIHDAKEGALTRGFTFIPSIGKGETLNATHEMRINLTDMLQTRQDLLVEDSEFRISTNVSMKAAELISLKVSSNLTLPWGAPLYNLTFAAPKFTIHTAPNSTTYYTVAIPTTFENHAFFDIAGTVHLSMYDNRNVLKNTAEIIFKAQQQSSFKENLQFDVPLAGIISSGYFKVALSTPFLDYGPLVIPIGE